MRDPNRIDKFLAKLGEQWKKVPDWRFGQFICNIPFDRDPFHVEDDEFLTFVAKLFEPTEIKEEEKN